MGTIRADLFFGSTYGLALAAGLWTVTHAPPPRDASFLLLLITATLAGGLALQTRRCGRLCSIYATSTAALLLYGPGAAVTCALGGTLFAALILRRPRRAGGRHAAFVLARTTLACSAAALAFTLALPAGSGNVSGWPVIAHAGVWALIECGLSIGLLRAAAPGRRLVPLRRLLVRATLRYAAGLFVALGIALAFRHVELRPWVMLAAVGWLLGPAIVARSAQQRLRRREHQRSESTARTLTGAFTRMLEARDDAQGYHSRRVQSLSLMLADVLGLSSTAWESLGTASLLRDIGTLGVPDSILEQPGRLTVEQMRRVRGHVALGAGVLSELPFPATVVSIVRHHHERWDGRGYPDALAGEAIPIEARILAVVDCYDALTSERPYRRALSRAAALDYLRTEANRMFDPDIVATFSERLPLVEPSEPTPMPRRTVLDDNAASEACAGRLVHAERELRALYAIERATEYGLPADELLTLAASRLGDIVPHLGLAMYRQTPKEGDLRPIHTAGPLAARLRQVTLPRGGGISGRVADEARALIDPDPNGLPDVGRAAMDLDPWADDPELGRVGSTLAVPIPADGAAVGVLALYDVAQRGFDTEEQRFVQRVAGLLAPTLSRIDDDETVVGLTDPLTGVPNARFLRQELAHRTSAGIDDSRAFGLLAFRLHGLEHIVEQQGNHAADRALIRFARRFAAGAEDGETVVRYGLDLFILLSPRRYSGSLIERWDELTRSVEEESIRISAAHASYPRDGGDIEALIRSLDGRLELAAASRTVVPFRRRSAV